MENRFIEDCQKLDNGKYRLIETCRIDNNSIVKKNTLQEKELIEEINGQSLPIYGTYLIRLWSEGNKNKNGRNYKRVFPFAIKENKITLGMADHPTEKEESVKDICLVCKNPQMIKDNNNENWLGIEVTLVGKPYGENFEAVLEAGGYLEFSSSCLGDVDPYSGEVLEEGFEIERWADVVHGSSNGILVYKDSSISKPVKQKSPYSSKLYDENDPNEGIQEKPKEDLTIYKSESLNEKKENSVMENKLLEKTLELNIKSIIKEAETIVSLPEKRAVLENALTYVSDLSDSSLKEEINKKINDTDTAIHELAEKGKSVEGLNESISKLVEENRNLIKSIDTLKNEKEMMIEKYDLLVKLYEQKQYNASETEIKKVEELNKKIKELRSRIQLKERDFDSLSSKVIKYKNEIEKIKATANTKVDADIVASLKEDNELLVTKVIELTDNLKKIRSDSIKEKRIISNDDNDKDVSINGRSKFDRLIQKYRSGKKEEMKKLEEKQENKDIVIGNEADVSNVLKNGGLI